MTGKKNNSNKVAAKLNQRLRTWADIKLSVEAKWYVSLSTVVLNSRDRQGIFKSLKKTRASKQPCNNIRPKIHPYTYWYSATNPKNVFKPLKYALEVELQRLENFLNNEIIVCQPACLPASLPACPQDSDLPLKPAGIWPSYFVQAMVMLVRLNLSYTDEDWLVAP